MADRAIDYDLKTIQQVTACGYEAIQRKGRGTYGFVYEVGDAQGDLFAFKYILPDVLYDKWGLHDLNEIDILSRVDHPHIIHAAKIITSHNCELNGLAVVLPLADRTLYDLMRDIAITTDDKLSILYKLATGLQFLHNNNILHLDIKTTNVVLQGIKENHPYFIDFGLSMVVDDVVEGKFDPHTRVTIDHRAPEILTGSHIYNAAVDIWAFGIMMLYTICGHGIFNVDFNTIKDNELHTIVVNLFKDPNNFDFFLRNVRQKYRPLCKNFFTRVLNLDPTLRLTALEICDHPLFDEFRYPINGTLIEPYIPHDYAADHRDILKVLIHWASSIYENSRAELLFLAIDLFNRVSSYYKDRSSLDRMSLAATCIWVAAKLTNSVDIPVDILIIDINKMVPTITPKSILQNEIEIIHLLSGILDISQLYRACKTGDELIFSFQHILISKDSNLYARTNIPAWIDVMKKYITETKYVNKNITITELLS